MSTAKAFTEAQPPSAELEPIAVVGAGCRFAAGINSPETFWEFLAGGRDAISVVPEKRWRFYHDLGPGHVAALRRATRQGSFMADIESFDAEFFGLSPREAEVMDPQHRILLEVTWEALEHAGIPPLDLAGGDTGVFVALDSDDYGRRLLEDLPGIEAWTGIGAAMCAAANRISYTLDLHGPSVALDTACSGSLVSVHLACQSLRFGECGVAIAGGVNVLLSPGLTLTLDAAGALAPDGRCKPFDAAADGYGRGEGCAVMVLKRLADAHSHGDRVLAVILGSAVSQDGRTSGIMAPNSEAQQGVLQRACRSADVSPGSLDYIETHGTGTSLGDQLEARALAQVYGAGREAGQPCLIGSVKANIGHLEAAAGGASLIKAILSVDRGQIPPSLNLSTVNPAVDWDASGLRIVTEQMAWPRRGRPRRAGVSAFGFGGTIAHVVIEQAPALAEAPADSGASGSLFPLSARSATALTQYASSLADWLSGDGTSTPLASVGHTLALRRSHLGHRAAIVARDRDELVARLRLLAAGEPSPDVVTATTADQGQGLVFVFSGHGSHWPGMGRELLTAEPAFAGVIDVLDPIFREELGFSPRQVLMDGELDDVARVQCMTFAMQTALAEVWRSYGVTPSAVIGHSLGEFAAAVAAGGLSLEDGARMSCRRARLLRRAEGMGAMVMVPLSFQEVTERLAGHPGLVAAIQAAPCSTVVSGDTAAIEALTEQLEAEDIPARKVKTDIAFHSHHMDPLLAETIAAAADLSPRGPGLPMYTTSLADPRATPVVDGRYWAANLRNPVRLAGAVTAASEDGYRAFLEISPHPVVTHSIRETLGGDDSPGDDEDAAPFIGWTLRRNSPEQATLLASAGALHCSGMAVDWRHLQPHGGLVTLPRVPWQRRRYWREVTRGAAGEGLIHDPDSHTLLGPRVNVAGTSLRLWRTRLDESCRPYPGSHAINGTEIVPASVVINTFMQAAQHGAGTLTDISFRLPLTVQAARDIQIIRDETGIRLASRETDSEAGQDLPWLIHMSAAVPGENTALPASLAAAAMPMSPADAGLIREKLASAGVPEMAFGWVVEELRQEPGNLLARIRIEQADATRASWAPVLDAALSSVQPVFPGDAALRLVAHIDEVTVTGEPPSRLLVDVTADRDRDDTVHVQVAGEDGRVVASLAGVRCLAVGDDSGREKSPAELVQEVAWRPLDPPADSGQEDAGKNVVLVSSDTESAAVLAGKLTAAGVSCRVVRSPEELTGSGVGLTAVTDVLVLPPVPGPGDPVPETAVQAAWLLAETAQRLAALNTGFPRLWCVTAGVRECQDEAQLAQASLWGLGRVIASEHPEFWGGVLDLPPGDLNEIGGALARALRDAPHGEVIAVAPGALSVARLTRTARDPVLGSLRCHADGTYLITGGLGTLGLQAARWLAERGARRIVLAGRRPFPGRDAWDDQADETVRRQIEAVRELEKLGVTVRPLSLDIADPVQVGRLLAPACLGLPRIRGIVHAAGVLDAKAVARLDEGSLRSVMRPKAEGAWVLHQLFPPGSLDFFVLFSSAGHLIGMPGQANYGAANAFLDGLAALRNDSAAPDATSFGWTSWRGQGMAANDLVDMERRDRGVCDISAAEAFAAWDYAWRRGPGHFPVIGLLPTAPDSERLPVLSQLADAPDSPPAPAIGAGPEPFALPAPEHLREHVLEFVSNQVAAEMKLPVAELNTSRSLIEQGLDSVMTMVIRRRLEKRFGHKLPSTLVWHRPTVTGITDHLVAVLAGEPETAAAGQAETSVRA